jgi:hypothetical protein
MSISSRDGQFKGDYHGFGQIACHGGGILFGMRAFDGYAGLGGFG